MSPGSQVSWEPTMEVNRVLGILMSSFRLHFIAPSVWFSGSSHMRFYLGLLGNVLISTMVSEDPILYFFTFPPLFLSATWEVKNGGVSSLTESKDNFLQTWLRNCPRFWISIKREGELWVCGWWWLFLVLFFFFFSNVGFSAHITEFGGSRES